MGERMPDFRMPTDEEVEAERAHDGAPAAAASSPPRRRGVLVAGVAAGVLVVGGVIVGGSLLPSPTPQAIVDDYVAAVASGDAAAAAALWMPEGTEAELALLAAAEPTRPATFACGEVAVEGDAATVTCDVELEVDPTPIGGPIVLELARDGQRWRLASGVEQRASLFTGVGTVATVAGVEVPDRSGVTDAPLLLPGVYEAEVVLSPFVVASGESIVVVGPRGGGLNADHELAQSVVDEAGAAAVEAVDPSGTGLEATLVASERRTWQTFVREFDVAPPGGEPVARVTVEVSLSADGTTRTIETARVDVR